MSPKKTFWIFLFTLALLSPWARAESWKDAKNPYEKVRERMIMIRTWKMTEALKLDREGAARFFTVDNQYEEAKGKLRRELHEDIHRLRNLMRDPNPPERELRDLVQRIKNRKKEHDDLVQRQTEEEMNMLRLEQQARYILFQIDFHKEMMDLIRDVREARPARPGYETPPVKIR